MGEREIVANGLNRRQIAFAHAVVFDRAIRGDPELAAIKAGFPAGNAYDTGHRLLERSDVQSQIRTNQRKSLADLATESLHVAREVLLDKDTPYSTRVTLIKAIWAQSGLEQPQVLDNPGDKPLTEKDKAELKAFVRDGLSTMAETAKQVRDSQVIDSTAGD